MSKLIKTWKELSQVPANDKYRIIVNDCCGWIVPICDEPNEHDFICNCTGREANEEHYENHVYLSTHTFYGKNYKYSTELLQKYGFDIEIDNWDKVGEIDEKNER